MRYRCERIVGAEELLVVAQVCPCRVCVCSRNKHEKIGENVTDKPKKNPRFERNGLWEGVEVFVYDMCVCKWEYIVPVRILVLKDTLIRTVRMRKPAVYVNSICIPRRKLSGRWNEPATTVHVVRTYLRI